MHPRSRFHRTLVSIAVIAGGASIAKADVFTTDAAPTPIPDLGLASLPLQVEEAFEVEDLNVILSLEHGDLSELRILLESSDGSEVVVFDGQTTGTELRFTSFDDEAPATILAGRLLRILLRRSWRSALPSAVT